MIRVPQSAVRHAALTVAIGASIFAIAATKPAAAGDETDQDATRKTIERLRQANQNDNQVMEHLRYMTKEIGPRLTGSDGINESYEWTRKQFESYGLEAWVEEWGEWPVGFNRGPWSGKVIVPGKGEKPLEFNTHSWTAGTDGPTRGAAILEPTSVDELEKLGGALKGAWIVGRSTRRGRLSGDARALNDAIWNAGIAGWVRGVRGELLLTSGSVRGITYDKLPTRVQVNLINSQWKELTELLQGGEKLELEFDIKNEFKPGPYKHYNVVADIKGTEKPDEFVIVGGHIDSWDGAEGSNDNGTGCATTLEAARLLMKAGARPKRTIRFILWSGEEQGLLGSAGYVRKHRDEMSKISAVLVHDGGTNTLSGITATQAMMPQMQEAMGHLVDDGSGFDFQIRQVGGLTGGGSDHNSYLAAGVPGFFWIQRGKSNYSYGHHTQHDNFDRAIPEYQQRSAFVVASGALGVANLEELLDRTNMQQPRGAQNRKVLGIQLEGMSISSITPDSRADKGGFKVGDKFISSGKTKIEDIDTLRSVIQAAEGKTPFLVERGGKQITLYAQFPEPEKKKPVKPKTGKRYY